VYGPVEDYPRTVSEFERRFATAEACRTYLVQLRWPDGFRCPKSGAGKAWPVGTQLECAACGRQTSVTAGTIFQGTRTPLPTWLLGTHQGAVSRAHLDYYLDEFTFRFNRRTVRHRGKLFYRLVQQTVAIGPAPYPSLVKHVRSERRRRRRHKI